MNDGPDSSAEDRGDTPPAGTGASDPSVAALVRKLGEQAQSLIRQEVRLAKAELGETARDLATGAAVMVAGAGLVLLGLLVLLAFLILALGALLGGRYWLSSLVVGAVFAVAGIVAVRAGRRRFEHDRLLPTRTIATVRETADWAAREAGRANGTENAG